jgi:hypothetical protein
MAKAAIRKLKERRFWRWLCIEVWEHRPENHLPVKMNRHIPTCMKFNRRRAERVFRDKVLPMIERYRAKQLEP